MDGYRVEVVRHDEAVLLNQTAPGALMQAAAAALASTAVGMLRDRGGRVAGSRVGLLVGSGDNGADVLYAGVRLRNRGVQVVAVGRSVHPDAADRFRAAGGTLLTFQDVAHMRSAGTFPSVDLIVDGWVGLSARPGLAPEVCELVHAWGGSTSERAGSVPILACDIPSGLDPNSGVLAGAHLVAAQTVTMGAAKVGLLAPPADQAVGELSVVPFSGWVTSAPPDIIRPDAVHVSSWLPELEPTAHKYQRGVLGLAVGSPQYPGAAVLCAAGAVGSGIGLIRVVSGPEVSQAVLAQYPQVTIGAGRVSAWVAGPGWPADSDSTTVQWLADRCAEAPVVVDAGALDAFVRIPGLASSACWTRFVDVTLTPHAGELSRMFQADRSPGEAPSRSDIEADPVRWAQTAAARWDVTCVLKGPTTVVASPQHPTMVIAQAPPELGTAGAGDVLAGVIGALLAQGLPSLRAATVGVWLHSQAATVALAEHGVVAAPAVARFLGRARMVMLAVRSKG